MIQDKELSKQAAAVYSFIKERMRSKGIRTITLADDCVSVRVRLIMKDLGRAQSELARLQVFDMTPGIGSVTYSLPEAVTQD